MDHHCCFTDNCVGARTFKPFFLFLCAFPAHALHTMIIALIGSFTGKFRIIKPVVLFFVFLYFIPISVMVISELADQIRMIRKNATWIEDKQKESLAERYRKAGVALVDEFDTGSLKKNLKIRIGSNPWLWLVPFPNQETIWKFARNPRYTPVTELEDE